MGSEKSYIQLDCTIPSTHAPQFSHIFTSVYSTAEHIRTCMKIIVSLQSKRITEIEDVPVKYSQTDFILGLKISENFSV